MNYIKQLNHYWRRHESCSLTKSEAGLYGYLLKRANDIADGKVWPDEIEVKNSVAMDLLNLSFRELQTSRDRLKAAELIDHQTRNGSKVVKYSFYDAETETFTKTFAPNAKVSAEVTVEVGDKVHAEVSAKVDDSLLLGIKQKPKPKALEQVQHGLFFEQFFAEAAEYDREQICVQIREKEIKREWCEIFNAHLHTERTEHKDYHSWIKHLRSWLPKKMADLKKGEAVQQQHKLNRHVY